MGKKLTQATVDAVTLQADHEPPIDCLNELLRLIREGNVLTFEFALHLLHVVTYVIDRLIAINVQPDGVLTTPYGMGEFDEKLYELCEELGGQVGEHAETVGAAPVWLYLLALKLLLKKLPDLLSPWLTSEQIAAIIEAIEKVIENFLN